MTFDTTINVANLLAVVVLAVGGLSAYSRLVARFAVMDHKLDILWKRFLRGLETEEEAGT